MLLLDIVAPGGHVSPETEQVSSPGSASSTHLEEHHGDEDDEDDEDDAAIETEIQSSDHEEVPIETVLPPNRPSTSTYDAIVASEGKIVDAENRRHSDMMTVLERMIGLQEETVSQLAHLHRVFIEVPKQLQKINTSFEALVVQQTQANYLRMTNVPQFNTSQAGSLHAGEFSPHSSDLHSPGPNVTGQVADIAQMQHEQNYDDWFPNLLGQNPFDWQNQELYLPPDVSFEEGSGDSYECLMEICLLQDSTVASSMDENAVYFWREQLQPNELLLLQEW
ncbi:uncharacterized protein LOC142483371 [Ascaphus truei]|uniref:uncharacterized protein LOC142483371 n=1 Tax=Ascaphus truei TaxID=8439 RepID=UPI003F591F5C